VCCCWQGGESDREANGHNTSRDRLSDRMSEDDEGENRRDTLDDEDLDEYDSEEDEDYDDRPKKKKKRSAVSRFIVEEAGTHVCVFCSNKNV